MRITHHGSLEGQASTEERRQNRPPLCTYIAQPPFAYYPSLTVNPGLRLFLRPSRGEQAARPKVTAPGHQAKEHPSNMQLRRPPPRRDQADGHLGRQEDLPRPHPRGRRGPVSVQGCL
jgi:hypothetical protein